MPRSRDDDDYDDRPRRRPRDDDDFDDEDDRPRRRPAKGGGASKVLIIVGSVLGVVVLGCCGVGYYVYRSAARGIEQVQQDVRKNMDKMEADRVAQNKAEAESDRTLSAAAATAFLQELRGDRYAAAYKLTTDGFRARTTEAEFTRQATARATDLRGASATVPPNILDPLAGTTFAYEIWTSGRTLRLTVTKEGGKWLVDKFTFDKGPFDKTPTDDENPFEPKRKR